MSEFKTFFELADKVMSEMKESIHSAISGTATATLRRTPVLTGQARGNWNFSVDTRDMTFYEKRVDPHLQYKPQEAIDVSFDSIGGVFYMINNVPYAQRLEYEGWSDQAPSGMLRVSIVEFNDRLKQS